MYYTVEITLTLKTPLHVGALSPAGTAARRGIVKTRDGWPYIPASSFKGRLRHAVERLADGLQRRRDCNTHRKMCRENLCPVCRIFGSPWASGPVQFADLELSGPPELAAQYQNRKTRLTPPPTTERYGVGLSRRRKVAADHLLYTTELFQPGVPLQFHSVLRGNITQETAAWLSAGVRYLDSVGSDRTRGLGWLTGEALVKDAASQVMAAAALRAILEPAT